MADGQRIKIWVKEPGKKPEKREIELSLRSLQEIVGGYVETLTIGDGDVIICNEEGLISDLPFNCSLHIPYGTHRLFGTIALLGADEDEFTSAKHSLESHGDHEERCYVS